MVNVHDTKSVLQGNGTELRVKQKPYLERRLMQRKKEDTMELESYTSPERIKEQGRSDVTTVTFR